MAGDWIKVEHVTPDKPEVVAMSETLGIDQDSVFGKLCRLWMWADQQSLNGHALSVTEMFLDRICCHVGFSSAMRKVGWLKGNNGSISFPNFDRHNGETAKARALATKRQQTKRSRSERDKIVTREEKRRDIEKVNKKETPRFARPTLDEVAAYCLERKNTIDPQRFLDHYEANGWRVGKTPMRDWQAAVRTWEGNQRDGKAAKKSRVPTAEDLANWNPLDGGEG